MPTVATLANTRMSDMPEHLAAAVKDAMYADGYPTRFTYNPFGDFDPNYAWLREEYAQTALDSLSA